ncbi:hypothetical protein [Micromonospora zhanjiangensis]|uniref:Uncharacterized protein n=1 Tax=Micromonospora zhanjiangensis TaxID=1522057 RepID=A0ABV8KJR3_9ACTN
MRNLVARLLRDERARYLTVGAVTSGIFYGIFLALWLVAGDRRPAH